MAITGPRPSSGLRLELARDAPGPPWDYSGTLATPEDERPRPLRARVTAAGAVEIALAEPPDADLAERIRLIVRAAWKHSEPEAPPRRIVRWRP